jgi:hypothetical protein
MAWKKVQEMSYDVRVLVQNKDINNMTTLTFDTLKYCNVLKQAGVDPKMSEAIAKATVELFDEALKNEVVTRDILRTELYDLEMRMYRFIFKSLSTTVTIVCGLQTILHFFGK